MIVTDAVIAPVAVGLNVTGILQLVPAATLAPQLFVCEKSLLFVPVTSILEMASAAPPLLLSVIVFEPLVVPISNEPKSRLDGVTMAAAPGWVEPNANLATKPPPPPAEAVVWNAPTVVGKSVEKAQPAG